MVSAENLAFVGEKRSAIGGSGDLFKRIRAGDCIDRELADVA